MKLARLKWAALVSLAIVALAGCLLEDDNGFIYRMAWYCGMDECTRTDEVQRYDRARLKYGTLTITSTVDENLFTDGIVAISHDVPREDCRLVHGLSLLGQNIEPAQFCYTPDGFELRVIIPGDEVETETSWLIMARKI